MQIVVIAHFAGSPRHGMVFGHYYLAREWVRLGHSVTIVAAGFAHTRNRQPECSGAFTEEWINGIRYVWVRAPSYDSAGRLGRVLNLLAFAWQTWWMRSPAENADLVVLSSHHPLPVVGALRLARRHGARLVFEVRDLWPLTLIELGGASRANPLIALMQWCEDEAYRRSDAVVSVLPAARDYMISRGMPREHFHFIPNGVDPADLQHVEPLPDGHQRQLAERRASGEFLVGYAGRVGLANALEPVVDAMVLPGGRRMRFFVLGGGSHAAALRDRAVRLGVADRLIFLPPVPKAQVSAFLAGMDATYIGLQQQPLFRFGVSPTKLNDYLLAAKPVIYAVDAPDDVVAESGGGISCPDGTAAAIADALGRLQAMSDQARMEMGKRGREWVIRERAYPVLARRFLDAAVGPTR
jgi:glycosyltransferase involved in cell wall biosynthesis